MHGLLRWVGLRDRARRRAITELQSFSAPQLADLGITRDQITAYVDGHLTPPRRRGRPALRLIRGGLAA